MIETTWMVAWWWIPIAAMAGGTGGFILAGIMYAGAYADQINEDALRELERLNDVEQMARESQR